MTTVTYRRLKQQLNAATLGETWSRWHDARIYTPATVGGAASWQELLREGSLIPVTDRHAIPSIMTESAGTRMRIAHLEHRIAATEVVSHTTALWVHCGGPLPRDAHITYRRHQPTPTQRARLILHQATLLTPDLTTCAGHQLTTLARTLVDCLTMNEPPQDLLQDAFIRGHFTTQHVDEARQRLHSTYRQRRQAAALAALDTLSSLIISPATHL